MAKWWIMIGVAWLLVGLGRLLSAWAEMSNQRHEEHRYD